jgi:hypothetical protein
LLGCGRGVDSIEHYIGCKVGRIAGRKLLRIDDEYEGRKAKMIAASKFSSSQEQASWAILVYGIYMATNHRRHGSGCITNVDVSVQEVLQFCKHAADGHPQTGRLLNTVWKV